MTEDNVKLIKELSDSTIRFNKIEYRLNKSKEENETILKQKSYLRNELSNSAAKCERFWIQY